MKLSLARQDLATIVGVALPTSVGVIDHLPDSVAPPVVLVAWGDPWVKPSTLCAYEARMELLLIAQRLEPGGQLNTLEEMASALVPALKSHPDYQVEDLTAPYPLQLGGVDYLAASINLIADLED